jgi:hypothetical protein
VNESHEQYLTKDLRRYFHILFESTNLEFGLSAYKICKKHLPGKLVMQARFEEGAVHMQHTQYMECLVDPLLTTSL